MTTITDAATAAVAESDRKNAERLIMPPFTSQGRDPNWRAEDHPRCIDAVVGSQRRIAELEAIIREMHDHGHHIVDQWKMAERERDKAQDSAKRHRELQDKIDHGWRARAEALAAVVGGCGHPMGGGVPDLMDQVIDMVKTIKEDALSFETALEAIADAAGIQRAGRSTAEWAACVIGGIERGRP